MEFISLGYTNKEVSELLNISVHTVRTFKMNIYKKLDISSLKELIAFGITFNL